jgi:hypothetical protein
MNDMHREHPTVSQSDTSAAGVEAKGDIRLDARLLLFLAALVPIITAIHAAGDTHFDFGVFYYAAHMVLDGSRHSLYDLSAQRVFQAQFHRPPTQLFYYPPIALIPFLCIAELPIELAFGLWTVASLAVVVWSVSVLARVAGVRYGNLPILLSLAFLPVSTNLAHGQVALLILGAYVLTYSLWRKERLFLGGFVLAIATLKFQLVIGFAAVLLLKRKWRELAGLSAGSALALAISVLITGVSSLRMYPAFVRHSEGGVGSEPSKMANLRGLLSLFGGEHTALLIGLSAVTILWAAYAWKDLDSGFSAAMLAAMLVSYHLNPQDLSLSLVPFFLASRAKILPSSKVPTAAFLILLAPMALAAVNAPYALLAILLAGALVWIGKDTMRHRGVHQEAVSS